MVLCTNIYPGRCDSDSAIVCIYCTKKKTRILCSFLASLSFLNFHGSCCDRMGKRERRSKPVRRDNGGKCLSPISMHTLLMLKAKGLLHLLQRCCIGKLQSYIQNLNWGRIQAMVDKWSDTLSRNCITTTANCAISSDQLCNCTYIHHWQTSF